MENVIILGTGCAGLTAAIYTARADLKPLIISGYEPGGQLTLTTEVENYPGFPDGVLGQELTARMQKQAEKFGARVVVARATQCSANKDGTITIKTDTETYKTKSLIIATGASAQWLNIESEKKFKGRGVHTCATCDGAFYKDKEIVVVGGGDSACEEAHFLTKFARKVTMFVRRDVFRASKIMQDRVLSNKKISIMWNTSIKEVLGDKNVQEVRLINNKTNKESTLKIDGVFLALGHVPNTEIFKGVVPLDEQGYVVASEIVKTNVPSVFVAGDVSDKKYRQAITAAGMGCMAALEVERYLINKH